MRSRGCCRDRRGSRTCLAHCVPGHLPTPGREGTRRRGPRSPSGNLSPALWAGTQRRPCRPLPRQDLTHFSFQVTKGHLREEGAARRWALVSTLLWLSSPPPLVPLQKRGSQAPSGKPAAPPPQIEGRGSNILPPGVPSGPAPPTPRAWGHLYRKTRRGLGMLRPAWGRARSPSSDRLDVCRPG